MTCRDIVWVEMHGLDVSEHVVSVFVDQGDLGQMRVSDCADVGSLSGVLEVGCEGLWRVPL